MKQSGNVLFLILIAVALFAALSYAVTQTGRSGGNIQKEQNLIQASSMLQHHAAAAQAVQRLMLVNQCTEDQISLANPDLAHPDPWGGSGNPNAPADGRCHLFDVRGGGISYRRNPTNLDDSVVAKYQRLTGNLTIIGVGDTYAPELTLFTSLEMNEDTRQICEAFNEGLGLPTEIQADGLNTNDIGLFKGVYGGVNADASGHPRRVGDTATNLIGQIAGCFQSNGWGNYYIFYYAVVPR